MKVGIIGLGLMGGSFSIDIKNIYKKSKIFGLDSSESNYQMSMKLKLIDGKLDDNNISDMDVVLISVPVDETVKILPDVLNKIGNKTLVIDVGSTKNQICKSVSDHKNRKQFLKISVYCILYIYISTRLYTFHGLRQHVEKRFVD